MNKNLSLRKTDLRTQLSVSYALMGVLPMLALGYLIWSYVDPDILSRNSLVLVVILTISISLFGFILLKQVIDILSDFRGHLKSVIDDRILDTAVAADHPTSTPAAESLEDIVYNLIKHNSRLTDMFSEMEETNWSKTRELARVNQEYERRRKREKEVEEELLTSRTQLSEALSKIQHLEKSICSGNPASVGHLASSIVHDINNALMPVIGFAEMMTQDETFPGDRQEFRNIAKAILDGAKEAQTVAGRLRTLYK